MARRRARGEPGRLTTQCILAGRVRRVARERRVANKRGHERERALDLLPDHHLDRRLGWSVCRSKLLNSTHVSGPSRDPVDTVKVLQLAQLARACTACSCWGDDDFLTLLRSWGFTSINSSGRAMPAHMKTWSGARPSNAAAASWRARTESSWDERSAVTNKTFWSDDVARAWV